jgi:hypothetical protein
MAQNTEYQNLDRILNAEQDMEGNIGMVEMAWEKTAMRTKMEMETENKMIQKRTTETEENSNNGEDSRGDLADNGSELENGVGVFVPKSP